jgi:hypothetical protein
MKVARVANGTDGLNGIIVAVECQDHPYLRPVAPPTSFSWTPANIALLIACVFAVLCLVACPLYWCFRSKSRRPIDQLTTNVDLVSL